MKTLDEKQLLAIKTELNRDITEVDSCICDTEQNIQNAIKKIMVESNSPLVSKELAGLQDQIDVYGKGVRQLRARLASLKEVSADIVAPSKEVVQKEDSEKKHRIAREIQHEIHNKSVTFTDFVKGLFMWQDTPNDRIDS